jgi:Domain of unknown function (DUF6089)
MKKYFCLILLCGFATSYQATAQLKFPKLFKSRTGPRANNFTPYSIVAFGLGTSNYLGEMAPYGRPFSSVTENIRWNLHADYTKHFSPNWSFRVGLTWARIGGNDGNFENTGALYEQNFIRNLHFRNDVKEFSALLIYDFVASPRNFVRRSQLVPYAFAGLSLFAHDPMALDSLNGKWVRLQPLGTEGQGLPGYANPYSLVQVAIPFGIGLRYKINDRWDVGVEGMFRYTFTDYLDDVGGAYANPGDLPSDLSRRMANRSLEEVSAYSGNNRVQGVFNYLVSNELIPNDPTIDPLGSPIIGFSDRGDPRGNNRFTDTFFTFSIKAHYYIPAKVKCPPLR